MEGSFVQHSVRILRELNKQRECGQYCDATLAVGSRVFRAHGSVLACCSSFFQSTGRSASGKIVLPETLAGSFALLLDFFYTGHLAVTPENWEQLLEGARELGVPEAVRLCQESRPCGGLERGGRNGQPSPQDSGAGTEAGKEDADGEPPALDAGGKKDSLEETGPSPCAQGSQVAQGHRGSPCLLRGRLKRAPQTNTLSSAGEVKSPPECKSPMKRGAGEEAGASNEVACGVMC